MLDVFDCSEIPSLEEILNYLPIEADDKEDIVTYIQNILSVICVNYKYEQYQFAYFGMHLLYMTYIYCSVWKISKICPDRYSDAVVFAKPYKEKDENGKKFDIYNVDSIFEYSHIPEKEIPKIFKIIDLDGGQIGNITGYVDIRNNMAHASGKFNILTDSDFDVKANTLISSIKNIHKRMDIQIRKWYSDILIKYCNGGFNEYTNINDIISEKMIEDFKLSINEVLVCNEMSLNELKKSNPIFKAKLAEFEKALKAYCVDNGYIE